MFNEYFCSFFICYEEKGRKPIKTIPNIQYRFKCIHSIMQRDAVRCIRFCFLHQGMIDLWPKVRLLFQILNEMKQVFSYDKCGSNLALTYVDNQTHHMSQRHATAFSIRCPEYLHLLRSVVIVRSLSRCLYKQITHVQTMHFPLAVHF